MSTERRLPYNKTFDKKLEGIQLATVIGHADPQFGGRLKVSLLRDQGNTIGEAPYSVSPAFPFFGNTAYEFQGNNLEDFNDTQKSYGMWFVPPDVGVTVMVVFIDSDPSQGYWIACIPPSFAHRMVPAIGADTNYALSTDDSRRLALGGEPLPVGEINRRINGQNERLIDEDKIKKPLHPVTDSYLTQGTLKDNVRGPVTSSSRRTPPNSVYGISTPGPLDRRPGAKLSPIGDYLGKTSFSVPVSRLGGTTFVMDDGDDRYQRTGPASNSASEYKDTENGEKGDPTIPKDEFFRIRTRTGHQLLMHNSEDLIYISNSKGTAWVELSANGKIDVYAQDSISIHSGNDLNVYADRDINLEAGRNINMKASADYSKQNKASDPPSIKDKDGFEAGRIQLESAFNTNVLVGANMKLETAVYTDANGQEARGNFDWRVEGSSFISTRKNFELISGENNLFTAVKNTDIYSNGNHTESAARIDMNTKPAAIAKEAEPIKRLTTHANIVTDGNLVWAESNYGAQYQINSIMKRVPMHEPWPEHENLKPDQLRPFNTDREG